MQNEVRNIGQNTAPSSSPVDNELVRIDNSLASLDTELGNLLARLGTVLEPEMPSKQESADPASIRSIERSWLHGNLRDKADKIDQLSAAVAAMRHRVTL
jgi:hypothetical protein